MVHHKTVFEFVCLSFLFFVSSSESKILDFKVITAVRHGLDLSLDYIDRNLYRVNVDCVLGVAFARAFLKSAYQNGSHIMDNSSIRLLDKTNQIIKRSRFVFGNDDTNGNDWKFQYLVDNDIWSKNIHYKQNQLLPSWKEKNHFFLREIVQNQYKRVPSSDVCLQEIVNSTVLAQEYFRPCIVTSDCWNAYFRSAEGHGYFLTHKLLLMQVAKARKCLLNKHFFDIQMRDICTSVMSDTFNANVYKIVEDLFDLFLEQVLLCGYEGFTEFIHNDWLYFILKSQRPTGCFPDSLNDRLKTRIKKNMTYFEDGCNDHSTGLGAAVLALYYNYLVEEESVE